MLRLILIIDFCIKFFVGVIQVWFILLLLTLSLYPNIS